MRVAWRPYRWDLGIAALLLLLIAVALAQILAEEAGIERDEVVIGETPATIYRPDPADGSPGPVVVVSHGFAGARPLMDPFALTLAHNGYTVVSFDYLGHGRHPRPLPGKITSQEGAAQALLDQTAAVVAYSRRELPGAARGLALLGHSMATNIIVRYAQQSGDVTATVAISMFAPTVDGDTPRNLLSVAGAREGRLKAEGREAVAQAAGIETGQVEPGRTYGDLVAGTARRTAVAPGVGHVGVLYSEAAQREALRWLNGAFGRDSGGWVSGRGPWLALLIAAVIGLVRPASRLLPRVDTQPRGAGAGWLRIGWVAGIPAVVTPLLLTLVPTDFLPVVVGDYVAVHFGTFGLLSALLLWWTAGRPPARAVLAAAVGTAPGAGWRLALGALGLLAYCLLVLGAVLDQFVTGFYPALERLPVMLALLAGMLPYFLTDEWLTRGAGARRGTYPATKLLLLVSLSLAIAVGQGVGSLSFPLMIVPLLLVLLLAFFLVYGLFSRWAYQRAGHPLVAGLGNAVAFAWALGATFPMLTGSP